MSEPALLRVSARTAAILAIFSLAFTALMAATYQATKPAIDASAEEEKMKLVNEVLPRELYDNNLLQDFAETPALPELGLDAQDGPLKVFRARKGGQPAALVFEAMAPDGYGGKIRLIMAVAADARVIGVRVVSHKETPGLGDYIDPRKDRKKASPWITQFNGRGFDNVAQAEWKVKKDGGRFDSRAGATISARAVTNATRRALQFASENRERLFGQQAGGKS
jgi:electron transport complex protein RnfG